jgi:hypothetical protein
MTNENVKHMHICCDGSFGNRYSGLIGGLTLARLCGLPATINWPSTNMCRARWEDLFEPVEGVVDWRIKEFYPHADKYDFLSINDQHMKFFGKPAVDPAILDLEHASILINGSKKNIFYYTPLIYDWLPQSEVNLTIRNLLFSPGIMNEVVNFMKSNDLSNGYYGIHIRMTDFKGIESFDVDHWINVVKESPDKKFFVCSDDPETEARFSELPNAFSYPKEYKTEKLIEEGDWHHPYTDEDGRHFVFNVERGTEHVKEAVVDFLLLSMSKPFDTGKQSTFLKMAKRVGQAFV